MTAIHSWTAEFASCSSSLPGAKVPWVSALRTRALDRFVAEGWPSTKQEDWHHTSLAVLQQQVFTERESSSAAADVKQLRQGEEGHWLVFVDGRYADGLSDIGALPAGVRIEPISEILNKQPELLEPYFGSEQDGFSPVALNLALAGDGAFVYLPQGVELSLPIHLVFVAATQQAASFPRNIVVAQRAAHATVVEHYIGQQSSASLTNTVTRLDLAPDANITHLKLQQENDQAFHLGAVNVAQQQGSVYNSHSMSFGARLARHDIVTHFNAERCEALLNGLYYVNGRQHVDHHTCIEHASPHGTSREYYRGILADTSRGVFTGRIRVSPGADGTDAEQRSDSLLLSRIARADTRPELEIYADDVKCAHGATVGQLDENSLFYLRSRGLDDAHARSLLTYAFAAATLSRIALAPLRQRVASAISALLPAGERLGDLL